ncbi:unnamed protein product [Strongylus vulgaris]|uniref:Uncharacterized protein n=1 Tax=Strongylus vulgaris TaxID=40348 RepID=A0A3P7K1C8_STRVU|nr:unnamed protein product [Strongylus vulgaris]
MKVGELHQVLSLMMEANEGVEGQEEQYEGGCLSEEGKTAMEQLPQLWVPGNGNELEQTIDTELGRAQSNQSRTIGYSKRHGHCYLATWRTITRTKEITLCRLLNQSKDHPNIDLKRKFGTYRVR